MKPQLVFIPEILRILHLYGLANYLQSWLQYVFAHASCTCLATAIIRSLWWMDIVNLFDIRLSAELCALIDDYLFLVLLGRQVDKHSPNILMLNFKLVNNTAALYNRPTLPISKLTMWPLHNIFYIYLYIYIFNIWYLFI